MNHCVYFRKSDYATWQLFAENNNKDALLNQLNNDIKQNPHHLADRVWLMPGCTNLPNLLRKWFEELPPMMVEWCNVCGQENIIPAQEWNGRYVQKCRNCGAELMMCSGCMSNSDFTGCDWNSMGCHRAMAEKRVMA